MTKHRAIGGRIVAAALAAGLIFAPLSAGDAFAEPGAGNTAQVTEMANPESTKKAADWLAKQFVDGKYLLDYFGDKPDVANTSDAVLALVAAESHPATVTAASEWIASQTSDYLKVEGNRAGRAARLALVAAATDGDPTNFGGQNLIEVLKIEAPKLKDDPYSSALAVLALSRFGEVPQDVVQPLLDTQKQDGPDAGTLAYAPSQWGDGVSQDATSIGLQALLAAGQTQAAEAARNWLVNRQNDAGYWTDYSPANTAGLAIPALRAAGLDTAKPQAWLTGFQLADGSFPAEEGDKSGQAYATAQAILGLSGRGYAVIGLKAPQQPLPAQPEPAASSPVAQPPAAQPSSVAQPSAPSQGAAPKDEKSAAKPSQLPRTGSASDLPWALSVFLVAGVVSVTRLSSRK